MPVVCKTIIGIPPARIRYPKFNRILLFGYLYDETKHFNLEIARKFFEKHKRKILKYVSRTKSKKTFKVYRVLSSQGNHWYHVVHNISSKSWVCNCPGYQYRSKCRHIKEARNANKS